MLKKENLKILVVICFHTIIEDDLTISLPSWIIEASKKLRHISQRYSKKIPTECLSLSIDKEDVLESRSTLIVYVALIHSFHKTFKKIIQDDVIKVVELGLGPQGELRYPSCCTERGWKYSVSDNLCTSPPKLRTPIIFLQVHMNFFVVRKSLIALNRVTFYIAMPNSCKTWPWSAFFGKRYFWKTKMAINVKLTSIDWWYNHENQSHVARVTTVFFTACNHDGFELVLKMLKTNNAGLNFAVKRSSTADKCDSDPDTLVDDYLVLV
ncbi:putative beta-amylase [Helianthus annuus]|nr:putative beta-amylase [Helianthus annuus]